MSISTTFLVLCFVLSVQGSYSEKFKKVSSFENIKIECNTTPLLRHKIEPFGDAIQMQEVADKIHFYFSIRVEERPTEFHRDGLNITYTVVEKDEESQTEFQNFTVCYPDEKLPGFACDVERCVITKAESAWNSFDFPTRLFIDFLKHVLGIAIVNAVFAKNVLKEPIEMEAARRQNEDNEQNSEDEEESESEPETEEIQDVTEIPNDEEADESAFDRIGGESEDETQVETDSEDSFDMIAEESIEIE